MEISRFHGVQITNVEAVMHQVYIAGKLIMRIPRCVHMGMGVIFSLGKPLARVPFYKVLQTNLKHGREASEQTQEGPGLTEMGKMQAHT